LAYKPEELTDEELNRLLEQLEDLDAKDDSEVTGSKTSTLPICFLKKLPPCTLAGFDLTAHSSAGDTTKPRLLEPILHFF
jgi:Zn-dependent M16 (insulinase) family peptidase